MFEPNSRYYQLPIKKLTTPEGRTIAYVSRRFLPQGNRLAILGEVTVEQSDRDRIDYITARTLGESEQFWQVCDANNAMNPQDLTTESGRQLLIPMPQI
ncbi:MAG: hypothetical protein QNJ33_04515 [Crocosphaera sp.]|nr:hypothetical protein [Crocosphaera sp.]